MGMIKLEGKLLKQVADANPTAGVVATSLALRERLRHFSDIRRTKMSLIKSGEKIVDNDYKKFWKDLEALEVGSIIYGRKGNPDRFEWHYNLKSVAAAAINGNDQEVERISKVPISKPTTQLTATRQIKLLKPEPSREKSMYIMLRDDFAVNFSVPGDITKKEIDLIVKALYQVSK